MATSVKNIILEIIAAIFILLFAYTGFNKMMEQEKFLYSLERSPALSFLAVYIAYLLPPGEIALAIALIIPRWRRPALLLSAWLMGIFTLYIGSMLIWAEELPCSCGGVISVMSWKSHLVFNCLLLALAIYGYRFFRYKPERRPASGPPVANIPSR